MVRLIRKADKEPFNVDPFILKIFELYHEMNDFPFEKIIENIFNEKDHSILLTKTMKLEAGLKWFYKIWDDMVSDPSFKERVGQKFVFKKEDIVAMLDLGRLIREVTDSESYEYETNLADFQIRWAMILEGLEGICDVFNDKLGDQLQEVSNKNFKTSRILR